MPETMRPTVLSVAESAGIEVADYGDTIVVRFKAPDGREIALLIPQGASANLGNRLAGKEAALDYLELPRRKLYLLLKVIRIRHAQ
jgi:hypothetical protein